MTSVSQFKKKHNTYHTITQSYTQTHTVLHLLKHSMKLTHNHMHSGCKHSYKPLEKQLDEFAGADKSAVC